MRVLALFFDLPRPDEAELKKQEENDETPRASLFRTDVPVDILDGRMLQKAPWPRRTLYRIIPTGAAQVIEAYFIQGRYDAVLSWYENAAYAFALLCKITGRKPVPHIAMCSWPGRRYKAPLIRLVKSHIDRFILWSSVQRAILIRSLKVCPERIAFLHYYVDQKFFRPMNLESDRICSVGSEMRDFPTFLEALRGLDIPCHIAGGTLRPRRTKWVSALESVRDLPPNVTIGRKTASELRELYARSRFVVIPLLESDTDNGITCILEAFAMGKPVICTRIKGQVDVIREGETGIFVPVGNPGALRAAMIDLWNNPEKTERMGRAARKYVEEHQTLDRFVAEVRGVVKAAVNAVGAEANCIPEGYIPGADRARST